MLKIVSKYLHVVPVAKVLAYRTVGQMHLLWRWPTILGQASNIFNVDSRWFNDSGWLMMIQDDSKCLRKKILTRWITLAYSCLSAVAPLGLCGNLCNLFASWSNHHHAPCGTIPLLALRGKAQQIPARMPGHKGIKFCKLARSLACYPGILVQLQDVDSDSSNVNLETSWHFLCEALQSIIMKCPCPPM